MTDIELKPCPFCGSAARPALENDKWVECSNLSCDAMQSGVDGDTIPAAAAWNRRAVYHVTPAPGGLTEEEWMAMARAAAHSRYKDAGFTSQAALDRRVDVEWPKWVEPVRAAFAARPARFKAPAITHSPRPVRSNE